MLNKSNIKNIIEEHQKEINEIEREIKKIDNSTVKNILNGRLSYLKKQSTTLQIAGKSMGN